MTRSSILDIMENLKQLDIEIQVSYAEDAFGFGPSMLCLSPVVAGKDITIQNGSTSICAYQFSKSFGEGLRDIWFEITHADYIILEIDKGYWNEGDPLSVRWIEDFQRIRYRWNGHSFEEFVKE